MAKYESALEITLQPTLMAKHDCLSNLENASVPSLHPAFQSALYHAMNRKKKNNQWDQLAETLFNTNFMKWWRRRTAWFYVDWMTDECIRSVHMMNECCIPKSNPSPKKVVGFILSCRVKKKLKGWVYKIHMFPFKHNNVFTWYDVKMCLSLSVTLSLLDYHMTEDG